MDDDQLAMRDDGSKSTVRAEEEEDYAVTTHHDSATGGNAGLSGMLMLTEAAKARLRELKVHEANGLQELLSRSSRGVVLLTSATGSSGGGGRGGDSLASQWPNSAGGVAGGADLGELLLCDALSMPMGVADRCDLSLEGVEGLLEQLAARRFNQTCCHAHSNLPSATATTCSPAPGCATTAGPEVVEVPGAPSETVSATNMPMSVSDLLHGAALCSTGSADLDAHLLGGLPAGFITEIVGVAGAGKSLLCHHLAAHAAATGAAATSETDDGVAGCGSGVQQPTGGSGVSPTRVIYVDDGAAPSFNACTFGKALAGALTSATHQSSTSSAHCSDAGIAPACTLTPRVMAEWERGMASLAVMRVDSLEELATEGLARIEALLLSTSNGTTSNKTDDGDPNNAKPKDGCRLVVIDSFAAIVRRSFCGHPAEVAGRHDAILRVLSDLKQMAEDARVAVVITNHTYAEYSGSTDHQSASTTSTTSGGAGAAVSNATFGNTFFHAVNTRLVVEDSWRGGCPVSLLRVAKSPVCPPAAFVMHNFCDSNSASGSGGGGGQRRSGSSSGWNNPWSLFPSSTTTSGSSGGKLVISRTQLVVPTTQTASAAAGGGEAAPVAVAEAPEWGPLRGGVGAEVAADADPELLHTHTQQQRAGGRPSGGGTLMLASTVDPAAFHGSLLSYSTAPRVVSDPADGAQHTSSSSGSGGGGFIEAHFATE